MLERPSRGAMQEYVVQLVWSPVYLKLMIIIQGGLSEKLPVLR